MTLNIRTLESKVVEIEAVQYDGTNGQEIFEWIVSQGGTATYDPGKVETEDQPGVWPSLAVETLEGTMKVFTHWWVFRGLEGEFYPCKNSVKEAKYNDVNQLVWSLDDVTLEDQQAVESEGIFVTAVEEKVELAVSDSNPIGERAIHIPQYLDLVDANRIVHDAQKYGYEVEQETGGTKAGPYGLPRIKITSHLGWHVWVEYGDHFELSDKGYFKSNADMTEGEEVG